MWNNKKNKTLNIIIFIMLLILTGIYLYQYYDYKKQINIIDNSDVDYIYIERLNIKRIIKPSFDIDMLNNGYIGMENINNNIVLAGHALEQIFKKLYNIKIGDKITINLNKIKSYYEVEQVLLVNEYNFNIYDYSEKLVLITCDYNRNKRRIIVSKKLT